MALSSWESPSTRWLKYLKCAVHRKTKQCKPDSEKGDIAQVWWGLWQLQRGNVQLLSEKRKKKKFSLGHAELFSNLTWYGSVKIAGNTASTFFPDFLCALTLHRSPTLQAGLRENELWRWLRQDVVAKYVLGRRWGCWWSTHCVQKHWSSFLVLRPSWCWVVNILEARRDLNRKTTHMSFLYKCQTQSVFQTVSSHSQWLNLCSVTISSIYRTNGSPKQHNS